MRYSKLFGKTIKIPPADAINRSHILLYQAGFIRESTAGRYFFLPLGQLVQQKIMAMIKKEMDKSGAQEMLSPVLHPLELWRETNRTNTTGFELTKVVDRRKGEFALGGTAEEMFVDVVRKLRLSYRDLPLNIYQFSLKFRDELRARGGLLRVREFIMKDAYSFDKDETSFKISYDLMAKTYKKIFDQLSLKTIIVESDNGYIGGEYCHEFVVESPIGETKFLTTSDGFYAAHQDVAKFKRDMVNENEPIMSMKIIQQPQWIKTMEDNIKHYKKPKSYFLKNVVYKNRITKDIIIAVIRGDLEVNKMKLEHVLNLVGQLNEASLDDLLRIGTKPGYVHSWGHKNVTYVADISLKTVTNFIGGQKEDETDSINVNYGRDFKCDYEDDIALAQPGHLSESGKELILKRGIEVGNIFQLGYHYSKKMKDATFTNFDGQLKPYYMGCYGIGIGRTMAAIVEVHNDKNGIIWPQNIAPYQVHLIGLDLQNDAIQKQAVKIYHNLLEKGIEVLFDDRIDIRAGQKFAEADLIGIPWRLLVSTKTGENVELKKRSETKTEVISIEETIKLINQ